MATEIDFPLFEVSDADIAFPTGRDRYLSLDVWSAEHLNYKREIDAFLTLFFSGGRLSDMGYTPKDGVDLAKAHRALRVLMGSWEPKHEQKEITVAVALRNWFDFTPPEHVAT